MTQKIVIDKTTKRVKRYGFCNFENDAQFDPNTEEIIVSDFFFDELPSKVVWIWNGGTETFDKGVSLSSYRIWCRECNNYYQVSSASVPSECPNCSGEDVEDITNEKFAIHGHVVSTVMPSGHYVFNLDDSGGNRWRRYKNFIAFPSKLDSIPSAITFSNVQFDGTANLVTEQITKFGFLVSITSTGKGSNWGFTGVEFDWEAVK